MQQGMINWLNQRKKTSRWNLSQGLSLRVSLRFPLLGNLEGGWQLLLKILAKDRTDAIGPMVFVLVCACAGNQIGWIACLRRSRPPDKVVFKCSKSSA